MILYDPKNREEWLKCRCRGLGGSDAGAVIGVNKYKTNLELWQEKTRRVRPADISDKESVAYGKAAEQYIRALFLLDHPEFTSEYHEYRMYANDNYPFLYATLDGELIDRDGVKGVLEIKTTTIKNSSQWAEWDDRIPDSYYAQVLHQLLATGWDFVILRAFIRYYKGEELRACVRDYPIEREEVLEDMDALMTQEIKFWECVKNNREPALIMPEI
ncbi:MAG: YqaJ viral recombinase family protein [Oscillospiraceae bacterium]|nr:YqaJ viral recombinase family protein [Oscillospiraceae bacterium]